MNATHQSIEASLAAAGTKATHFGATTSVVGWMLSSEFGMLVGLGIALAGLSISFYYQRKRDKREQAEHDKRMRDRDEGK
jgi:hypothetical protein